MAAPEGISRLMLSHRRLLCAPDGAGPRLPSPSLRAVFVSAVDPDHAGGLVGLALRLKSDGHGRVHVLGPRGIAAPLAFAAQEIARWTHPAVLVTEHEPEALRSNPLAYSDDFLSVYCCTARRDRDACEDWSSAPWAQATESSPPRAEYPSVSCFTPACEGSPVCLSGGTRAPRSTSQAQAGTFRGRKQECGRRDGLGPTHPPILRPPKQA